MGNVLGGSQDELGGVCCDVKLVILASKKLEAVLEKDFGGTGRGLHEKIESCGGSDIPPDLKRKVHKIATIRNRLIHDVEYDAVDDPIGFRKDFQSAISTLREIAQARGKGDPFAAFLSKCTVQ
jgi:hypothetical protein